MRGKFIVFVAILVFAGTTFAKSEECTLVDCDVDCQNDVADSSTCFTDCYSANYECLAARGEDTTEDELAEVYEPDAEYRELQRSIGIGSIGGGGNGTSIGIGTISSGRQFRNPGGSYPQNRMNNNGGMMMNSNNMMNQNMMNQNMMNQNMMNQNMMDQNMMNQNMMNQNMMNQNMMDQNRVVDPRVNFPTSPVGPNYPQPGLNTGVGCIGGYCPGTNAGIGTAPDLASVMNVLRGLGEADDAANKRSLGKVYNNYYGGMQSNPMNRYNRRRGDVVYVDPQPQYIYEQSQQQMYPPNQMGGGLNMGIGSIGGGGMNGTNIGVGSVSSMSDLSQLYRLGGRRMRALQAQNIGVGCIGGYCGGTNIGVGQIGSNMPHYYHTPQWQRQGPYHY